MTELWQLGALELADRIRSKEVSSREVLEAHLSRVEACNGALNAVVRVLADEARAAADAADESLAAGNHLGPLHGVPCTVKENIDVAGTPTTQGVKALADAIATIDAPTVERMRAAGAIPFARTNLPDFGLRVHTDSELHGITRNPWNPEVTAGGSSGGEGAAIASGMSPIGLGNDIGGSLRNPAHCCGIVSLKPTVGVIPMATVVPPEDMSLSAQLMVVEGPMARRVADVRAGLQILAGQHWRDPRSVTAVLTDAGQG
jgi:amidase